MTIAHPLPRQTLDKVWTWTNIGQCWDMPAAHGPLNAWTNIGQSLDLDKHWTMFGQSLDLENFTCLLSMGHGLRPTHDPPTMCCPLMTSTLYRVSSQDLTKIARDRKLNVVSL